MRTHLVAALAQPPAGTVTVLPDFFLDRFVRLDSWEELARAVKAKAARGGGSVHYGEQLEMKGGNAVNLAFALGRLGVATNLITVADTFAKTLLKRSFEQLPTVQLVIVEGRPGYTVAFEFPWRGRLVNVMVGDPGDVSRFSSAHLGTRGWEVARRATWVVLVNWAAIYESGTALAREVLGGAKAKGAHTFLDPADVTVRTSELRGLIDAVFGARLVDVLSVNENEADAIDRFLGGPGLGKQSPEALVPLAERLARVLDCRVDIHTPRACATAGTDGAVCVGRVPVEARVSTGAGDVWDAGDLYGYLARLDATARLSLANLCGALYVASATGHVPTRDELAAWLRAARAP